MSFPVNETQILKHKQHELVNQATEEVAFADQAMWSGLKRRLPALRKGCKTLLLELVCGAMVMAAVAATRRGGKRQTSVFSWRRLATVGNRAGNCAYFRGSCLEIDRIFLIFLSEKGLSPRPNFISFSS